MVGISDKALKSNYTENKYQYGGKELQHQEFSDGTGLEEYDFGARTYDPQIGRWTTIDPMSESYALISPYVYLANDPILFIEKDGRTIGNPDDKAAKDVKAALMKTESGAAMWKQMEQSKRTIYLMYGNVSKKSDERTQAIGQYLRGPGNAMAETLSKSEYEAVMAKGSYSDEEFNNALTFNPKTGEYDKTSDWDETYIFIDETKVKLSTAMRYSPLVGGDQEKATDLAVTEVGGEEGAHSLQNSADMKVKEKNPQTGLYKNNTNDKTKDVDYYKSRTERQAKQKVLGMINEALKKNGMSELKYDDVYGKPQ